jgi:anti-anti-sigma regulatory factor
MPNATLRKIGTVGAYDLANAPQQDQLKAAVLEQRLLICVEGRGSFRTSSTLKQFVHRKLRDSSLNEIILDMAACTGMDSTFMGVLAGLASHPTCQSSHRFHLTHLSEKNEQLLKTLGVNRVVTYSREGEESPTLDAQAQMTLEADQRTQAETSIEAHQNLVELSVENEAEFRSVIELLQQDLDQMDNLG